jgi:hypothetical protein
MGKGSDMGCADGLAEKNDPGYPFSGRGMTPCMPKESCGQPQGLPYTVVETSVYSTGFTVIMLVVPA